MGRNATNTADYFPHMAKSGKTLVILEGRWGNNGYAFWFKLLETLTSSEGHYFDCNLIENWEYLVQKSRLDGISVTEIISMLARLGNIDLELWEKKIIWCQALVDNLASVYKKRQRPSPVRPVSGTEMTPSPTILAQKSDVARITEPGIDLPHLEIDKAKQRKEKKSRAEQREKESAAFLMNLKKQTNEGNLVYDPFHYGSVPLIDIAERLTAAGEGAAYVAWFIGTHMALKKIENPPGYFRKMCDKPEFIAEYRERTPAAYEREPDEPDPDEKKEVAGMFGGIDPKLRRGRV